MVHPAERFVDEMDAANWNGHPQECGGDDVVDGGVLRLDIEITDREVVNALRRHPEGRERHAYALAALRIGVFALDHANGMIDARAVRDAGQQLITDVRHLLTSRAQELTGDVAGILRQYFDPATGQVTQRIHALVRQDGDLDQLLHSHLAGDDSVIATTLAAHLGAGSPIFRMLSPTDANGLRMQIERTLETALAGQRAHVLREFSLDNKESALSRLVNEISVLQSGLKTDVAGQVDTLAKEFSLDRSDSALSRLVAQIEKGQAAVTAELSADNDDSALNRLMRLVQQSANAQAQANSQFHAEVRETLAALKARRDEARRSPTHGGSFEEEVARFLSREAQRVGDVYETVANKVGIIKNCKKGDHLVTLGPESPAPGVCIAWESKDDKRYDVPAALTEIEEARKNRQAQIGVFVYAKQSAPTDLEAFARYRDDLIIVWDAEDPATDIYLKAAYSVARALAVRLGETTEESEAAIKEIESATRAVEKQVGHLEEIQKWAGTAENAGRKIRERVEAMQGDLRKQVQALDSQIEALKKAGGESQPPA